MLPDKAVKSLGLNHSASPEKTLAIVASHDCDLAQHPDKEPDIEIVVGRCIANLDGNNTHAKSSRTLHIEFEGDKPLRAEFVITNKRNISKNTLLGFMPVDDLRLSPEGLVTFQQWLSSRYRRSAFPDEFERRLVHQTKLAERIAKAVKPHGKWITAVFFDVDEGLEIAHIGPDDVYLLDIILLHATEPDFDRGESAAIAAKNAIEKAFKTKLFDKQSGKWKNIELRRVDVYSEESMSYRLSTLLKRWRLDYISLGAEPQQPVLTD